MATSALPSLPPRVAGPVQGTLTLVARRLTWLEWTTADHPNVRVRKSTPHGKCEGQLH